jgi:hypothetical protein
MELQQLLHFKELGMGIADKSILRAAFITNKREVIADMEEQQQQQAQIQQTQMQQQAQVDQVKMQSESTKAMLNQAKVAETYAKIDDLEAGAEHKRTAADLDMVRAMITLEDMDLANFRQNLEMAEIIKLTQGHESKHPEFRQEQKQPATAGQG